MFWLSATGYYCLDDDDTCLAQGKGCTSTSHFGRVQLIGTITARGASMAPTPRSLIRTNSVAQGFLVAFPRQSSMRIQRYQMDREHNSFFAECCIYHLTYGNNNVCMTTRGLHLVLLLLLLYWTLITMI